MKCFRIVPFLSILLVSLLGCNGGSGELSVVTAIITVDGDPSDWEQTEYSKPVFRDDTGDADSSVRGMDITDVYIAQDGENIYVRIDVVNGPPSAAVGFGMTFPPEASEGMSDGERYLVIDIEPAACSAWESVGSGSRKLGDGKLAFQGDVIEFSVKRAELDPPSPSYVECWSMLRDSDETFDNAGGPGVPVAF